MTTASYYLDAYNKYVAMNMKDEALDSLLIGMRKKDEITKEAEEYQVVSEVESVYSNIESILASEYSLDSAQIEEVNALEDASAYTKRVMEITGTINDIMPSES